MNYFAKESATQTRAQNQKIKIIYKQPQHVFRKIHQPAFPSVPVVAVPHLVVALFVH